MNFSTVPLEVLAVKGIMPHTSPPKPMIVIVDDEVTIADTLRTITMQRGFASFAVYDARSALELIRVVPPDLLLTDFGLPWMSGLELAIQVAETCPACKIILFSGLVSVEEMESMCRKRHSEFALLEKPLHPDLLLASIADLLQMAPTASRDGHGK